MSDESNKKNAHDNLVHAGEFTKIENTAIADVLRGWFAGLSGVPGALEAGDDAWANTTLFEHFREQLAQANTFRVIGEREASLVRNAVIFPVDVKTDAGGNHSNPWQSESCNEGRQCCDRSARAIAARSSG